MVRNVSEKVTASSLKSAKQDNIISLLDIEIRIAIDSGRVFKNMEAVCRQPQGWSMQSTTIDPQFILYYNKQNPIDASKYTCIAFDLYVDGSAQGQLFWWLTDGRWQGSLLFNVTKGWRHYCFNMKTIPTYGKEQGAGIKWEGMVDTIRLDPVSSKGVYIEIKNIELSSRKGKSNADFVFDSTENTSENIELNYKEISKLPRVLKSKPVLIYAEVSTKCNLKCRMCGRAHYKIPSTQQGFMEKGVFEKLAKLFTNNAQLALFGRGETLLHPDFIYFLELARKAGMRVGFNTNGLMLTETIARAMVEHGQTHITFSCSAGSPEMYEKVHCIDGWEKLWRNIDLLNSMKFKYGVEQGRSVSIANTPPAVYLEFVSQRINISGLPALVRKAVDHHIKGVLVIDMVAHSKKMESERMNIPENLPLAEKYYKEAMEVHAELKATGFPDFELRLPSSYSSITKKFVTKRGADKLSDIILQINKTGTEGTSHNFCLEPWQTFYVRFDGTVAPCVITGRVLGDLKESSAEEVWNGSEYQKFRQRMKGAKKPFECMRCHLFPGPKRYDKRLSEKDCYDQL